MIQKIRKFKLCTSHRKKKHLKDYSYEKTSWAFRKKLFKAHEIVRTSKNWEKIVFFNCSKFPNYTKFELGAAFSKWFFLVLNEKIT